MTVPQFSRPGAIDLSALRRPTSPTSPGGAGTPGGGGGSSSYAFDVTSEESLLTDVVERSTSVVVLVSFWSEQAPGSSEINATLTKLAGEFAGRFLFARVDVGAQPALAQAIGIPQVPLVVAALRGQLAPLIQEPLPEAEMRTLVEKLLQTAVANGVTGTAAPVGPTDQPVGDEAEEVHEAASRYPAAEEALMAGDLDSAIAAYEQALEVAPADPEAKLGLAQARLLRRTQGIDVADARAAAADRPDDVAAQMLASDLDFIAGQVEVAFGRLIELVRRAAGDGRETARQHLIELFDVAGDADPQVLRARQQLASALF